MGNRKPTADIGSISDGTLNPRDLLAACADALQQLRPYGNRQLISDALRCVELLNGATQPPKSRLWHDIQNCGGLDQFAGLLLDDMAEKLSDAAPAFCYFGASDGDGAAIGFWPDWESVNELEQFDDTGKAAECGHVGEFRCVSDHGNVTLYCRHTNGRVVELWGVV